MNEHVSPTAQGAGASISLCVPPRAGELCAPLVLELPSDQTTQQLTARHLITGVTLGPANTVLVAVEIADPATARPIDVRFDVVPHGLRPPAATARHLGSVERSGRVVDVHGTYLGPVADEN